MNASAPRIAIALAIALTALGSTACSKEAASAAGQGRGRMAIEFPVEVIPVEARDVTYSLTAVGSVDAFEQVEVTARVAGAVERVLFAEGQMVRAGQALVEIEPQRYRIAVDSARPIRAAICFHGSCSTSRSFSDRICPRRILKPRKPPSHGAPQRMPSRAH